MDKAVILVSGGINSAVAAAVAREQYAPALLHVTWTHRAAEREKLAFEQVAARLSAEATLTVDLTSQTIFGNNARVSKRQVIEDATTLGHKTPATFVPGLLPSMLGLAAAWAGTIGARRIILGISEDHDAFGPPISELYPDHRIEFLQTYNLMLRYASSAKHPLELEAPLVELSRSEVVQLGHRLNVPFDLTWSCYAGNSTPCQRCHPCTTRAAGFLKAKIPDPLLLQPAGAAT